MRKQRSPEPSYFPLSALWLLILLGVRGMTPNIGGAPPIHRRFNEAGSLEMSRERYRRLRPTLSLQVELLQKALETRIIFREFYDKGYKDWNLISAIFNMRLTWASGLNRKPIKERPGPED